MCLFRANIPGDRSEVGKAVAEIFGWEVCSQQYSFRCRHDRRAIFNSIGMSCEHFVSADNPVDGFFTEAAVEERHYSDTSVAVSGSDMLLCFIPLDRIERTTIV